VHELSIEENRSKLSNSFLLYNLRIQPLETFNCDQTCTSGAHDLTMCAGIMVSFVAANSDPFLRSVMAKDLNARDVSTITETAPTSPKMQTRRWETH
jgi:hypothetical protein